MYLHNRYRDFKRSLQQVQDGSSVDAARQTMESLIQVATSESCFIGDMILAPLLHWAM